RRLTTSLSRLCLLPPPPPGPVPSSSDQDVFSCVPSSLASNHSVHPTGFLLRLATHHHRDWFSTYLPGRRRICKIWWTTWGFSALRIASSTAEHPPDGYPGRLLFSHYHSTSLTGHSAPLLAPISSPVGPSDGQPATARHLTSSLPQEPITSLIPPFRPAAIEASPRRATVFLTLSSLGSFAFELLGLSISSLLLCGILSLLTLLPSTA
ncbi:hypothetical protein CORC01_07713, partial [Colletotrichum orchidophilum]